MEASKRSLGHFSWVISSGLRIRLAAGILLATTAAPALADETCMSPFMPKITGQEDYVYVWTLGVEGMGDGSDKLVTVDVRPGSATYGKVIASASVGGRHEAHHGGFTDDRRYFWTSGLDTSRIFIFDIHTDPARPRLERTIDDFVEATGGVVGPHGAYALPGRMLMSGLSNAKDEGGRTALVEYTNDGKFLATHWMPTSEDPRGAQVEAVADGYGYDQRVLPRKNVMLTSSFTGKSNYMMDFGKMLQDPEAMKRFGQTVVLWDFHARQPRKVFHVPGAPLEIRWAWGPDAQLRLHHHGADLEDLADPRGYRRRVESQGGRRHRQSVGHSAARGHQPERRRQDPVRGHLHGRQGQGVRRQRSARAEADPRTADRPAGEHGVPVLGREARLLHHLAARELGQEGRRQRPVHQGL